ncbi:MAG TPA: alpha/beta hydrolase [Acidimicrobiales bacterium]|nr:alpha/beta hydrolase [Acidimicrobiales bacterium]
MTYLDRVDPELRPTFAASPVIDLSKDIPKLRAAMTAVNAPLLAAAPETPDVESEDRDAEGVRVRVYRRTDTVGQVRPAMLWIHGGGMCFGSVEGDDFMCRTWTSQLGCVIVSVDYRLAPEHPYPAPVEDCTTALRWLAAHTDELDVDPSRIVVGGASAGGGLAAGTVLRNHADGNPVPIAFQVLIFPMIDDRFITPSSQEMTDPHAWNRESNRHGWAAYLGRLTGSDDVPIDAAPARATVDQLRGLPPAYIDVGELDPFRDEDIAYAQKLLQAGVACELHVTPGAYHASEASVLGAASSRRIRGYRRDVLQRVLGTP